MPIYKSEKESILQHLNYAYDTDMERKYEPTGQNYLLYVTIRDAIPDNSIILDVGCNSGAIGRLLMMEKCVVCYGIDVSPELTVRAVLKGILAKSGKAEELPWSDDHFDVIILMEILEHVYDAQKVLDEAVRVVKPEGIVVGSVPHPKGQAGAKGFINHAYHARVFDKKSLKKLLKSKLTKVEIKDIYVNPDITGLPNWMFFRGVK